MPPAALVGAGYSEHEARTLKLFKGRGCERCNNTGYKGRVGLYEVMEVEDEMREMILSGASSFELRQKAIQNGMLTLRMSGLQKVRDGMTTAEEVVRETVL
jgi:type IV pilus assembly protein PilB